MGDRDVCAASWAAARPRFGGRVEDCAARKGNVGPATGSTGCMCCICGDIFPIDEDRYISYHR